jgi:uncharacterized protein YggE
MKTSFVVGGVTVITIAAIAALSAAARPSPAPGSGAQITVYGVSQENYVPKDAQVSLGVTTSASTAAQALQANNRIVDQVVAALKPLDIKAGDIATAGLNINPNYNQSNPPAITGYQASDNLTITTTMANLGRVIDTAVAHQANQVNGISFITPPLSAYRTAYDAALHNALVQAGVLKSRLGYRDLTVKSVVVEPQSSPSPMNFAAASAPATPIFPGQQQESLTLKIVFELHN